MKRIINSIKKIKNAYLSSLFGIMGNLLLIVSIFAKNYKNNGLYDLTIMGGFALCVIAIPMSLIELTYVKNKKNILIGLALGMLPFLLILTIGLINVIRGITV